MRFGFEVPIRGELASPASILEVVSSGESIGYAYGTIGDHIVLPSAIEATYPYSNSGEFTINIDQTWLEQFATLSFLLGATSTLEIFTSITVLAYRPPIQTAKFLATIDWLSGSRLILGCGTGWLGEEFDILGAQTFDDRGRLTDEYIEAFVELWSEGRPSYSGRYVEFSDIAFWPKPANGRLPLWIGGESPAAMRRAARLGDGWMPIGANPRYSLATHEQYANAARILKELTTSYGREAESVRLGYRSLAHGEHHGREHDALLMGPLPKVAEDVSSLREVGVEYIDFRFTGAGVTQRTEAMQQLWEDVLVQF